MLEWTPEEASLLQDPPFSAAASVYISREAWETHNHQTFSSTGYLRTRGQETCACVIHTNLRIIIIPLYETLHDRPLSVTSEDILRDSEPPDSFIFLLDHGTGFFVRSECIKLVLVSIYTHCQLHMN